VNDIDRPIDDSLLLISYKSFEVFFLIYISYLLRQCNFLYSMLLILSKVSPKLDLGNGNFIKFGCVYEVNSLRVDTMSAGLILLSDFHEIWYRNYLLTVAHHALSSVKIGAVTVMLYFKA
jgi:hypothetical protein